MKDNWVAQLPVLPLSAILQDQILAFDKHGNLQGQQVTFSEYYNAVKQRIQRTNVEILNAKNRDDVAAAESRLRIFTEEDKKLMDSVKITAIEGLLRTIYACTGYVNGENVIVPAREWVGTIDWEQESLTVDGRHYSRIRSIASARLTEEQREKIKNDLNGTSCNVPEKSGFAGKPSSKDLVKAEFDRRAKAGEVANTLAAESEYLEAWLKHNHPKAPQAGVSAIANNLRSPYNAYKSSRAK